MELPPGKIEKIMASVATAISQKRLPLKEFRILLGKLQHTALAMLAGKSILTPFHKFLEANKDRWLLYFANNFIILEALRDIRILLRESTSQRTFASSSQTSQLTLVSATPASAEPVECGSVVTGTSTLSSGEWNGQQISRPDSSLGQTP